MQTVIDDQSNEWQIVQTVEVTAHKTKVYLCDKLGHVKAPELYNSVIDLWRRRIIKVRLSD